MYRRFASDWFITKFSLAITVLYSGIGRDRI